jgi:hypothetical protein
MSSGFRDGQGLQPDPGDPATDPGLRAPRLARGAGRLDPGEVAVLDRSRGGVEQYFSSDLLLTNVTLYWVTGTANAANRSYYERAREPRRITSRITVPTGMALSTEVVQRVPRERAERSYADIRHRTEFPRGGHFFAAEEPRLLAEELRAFFRPFRQGYN